MQPPFWYQLILSLLKPIYRYRIRQRATNDTELQAELTQRFGPFIAAKNQHSIWFHAVSVGETNAAQPLIQHYLNQGHSVLVTNTTKTGQARAKALFENNYPTQFEAVFLPVDQKKNVVRFLKHYQPRILLLMETELWPNLLATVKAFDIPQLLINARLSEKSAKGYARFKSLTQPMLNQLNWIAVQDQAAFERFAILGKSTDEMNVTGNIKFDIQPPHDVESHAEQLIDAWQLQQRKIMVLASTHAPEERDILTALKPYLMADPQLICIVVPRHPERFASVLHDIQDLNLPFAQRSLKQPIDATTQVYLADSMGELWLWYAIAQAAFVGGSLNTPGGGHNILEPIALRVATVLGTNYFNFQTIVDEFKQHNAIAILPDAASVAKQLVHLCQDKSRQSLVQHAQRVLNQNQGALKLHIQLIDQFLIQ